MDFMCIALVIIDRLIVTWYISSAWWCDICLSLGKGVSHGPLLLSCSNNHIAMGG
jgi:hypothetical protein